MKYPWASFKILIWGAGLFFPSIASAHGGPTKEMVVSFFLVADFVVLGLAIWTYLLSKSLNLRWARLFSGINIAGIIVGVLSNCINMYEKDNLCANTFWFDLGAYSTGYLWIAVPLHLVVLLFLVFLRYLFKKPDISKSEINEQRLDQTQPAPAIHISFGGKT